MQRMVWVVLMIFVFAGLHASRIYAKADKHEKGQEKHLARKDHDGDKGRKQDKEKSREQGGEKSRDHKSDRVVVIDSGHRTIIHEYYKTVYVSKGNCPPGLAKKKNGCLPPGQAKKLWVLNQPLPSGVILVPLPRDLIIKMGPPPHGYEWGYVDGDILLYSVVGKVVVDAISSLF